MLNRPKRSNTRRSHSRLDKDASPSLDGDLLRARRRRNQIASKIMAGALLLGSLWVLYTLLTNQRFQVTNVTIKGAGLISEDSVRSVLDLAGTSIFCVRAEALDARLRATFGCIEQVSIACWLPDQVQVSIKEAEVPFLWESGGRYWWMDAQGNVLGMTEGPGEMVVIHDVEGIAREPRGYIVGVPWELANEMTQALPGAKDYDFTQEEGLVIRVTTHEWPVYLGRKGDAQAKVALVRELANQLITSGIDVVYIDVGDEQRATYKRR